MGQEQEQCQISKDKVPVPGGVPRAGHPGLNLGWELPRLRRERRHSLNAHTACRHPPEKHWDTARLQRVRIKTFYLGAPWSLERR